MSLIDVAFTAFPVCPERVDYFKQTVASLKHRLRATGHELHWICASESRGVDPDADARQRRLCAEEGIELVYQRDEPCLGRNLNLLRRNLRGEFSLYVQDDFILSRDLDLEESVSLCGAHAEIMLVHYRRPFHWALSSRPSIDAANHFHWLPNDVKYKYQDSPHLARREFYRRVGDYGEYALPGRTEQEMDERVRELDLGVVARVPFAFDHVGAVSARKLQRARGAAP